VYEEEQREQAKLKLQPPMLVTAKHAGQLSQHSSCASSGTDEIVSKQSPKSVSNGGMGMGGQRFLHSPNSTPKRESLGGSLSFHQSVSYSTASSAVTEVMSHNAQNSVELMEDEQVAIAQAKVTSMSRISRGYNKRKYKEMPQMPHNCVALPMEEHHNQRQSLSSQNGRRSQSGRSSFVSESKRSSASRSPRSPGTKTKKKGYFFESKSRGSKKLAKIIGK